MHYYKRNIGDYNKKAGRLTMLQHGAYTLLMDACYDREKFPTKDEAIDWLWASTPEEISAVEFVLSKFFTEKDGVFVQNRIQDELDKYHRNSATNKRIAIEREAKRKDSKTNKHEPCTDGSQVVNETPPNQEPLTTNQEPPTKKKRTVFKKPTPEEVQSYFEKKGYSDKSFGQKFVDHYESNGWMVGKTKMKSWQAAVRNWITRGNYKKYTPAPTPQNHQDHVQTELDRIMKDF